MVVVSIDLLLTYSPLILYRLHKFNNFCKVVERHNADDYLVKLLVCSNRVRSLVVGGEGALYQSVLSTT